MTELPSYEDALLGNDGEPPPPYVPSLPPVDTGPSFTQMVKDALD